MAETNLARHIDPTNTTPRSLTSGQVFVWKVIVTQVFSAHMKRSLPLLFLLLPFQQSFGQQDPLSWPGMGYPVNIPMLLSGNFGELRSNHFHMGIDIKTQGVEGLDILAVEDGYVSRIKISPYGYGKAVYIDHPNGYTTVYGHLKELRGELAQRALKAHYAQERNAIDIYLQPDEVPVSKGQVIAISGNTGGSGGPHLHFEVRQTDGQLPINPLRFNLPIKDDIPPTIKGIRLYPADAESSKSPYMGRAKGFIVEGSNGKYRIRAGLEIAANGRIGIAVHAIDKMTGSHNKCGIYSIRMSVDGKLVYSQAVDILDFGTQRYVNAHMDYGLYIGNDMHYHKCFQLPNDKLGFYNVLQDKGYITVGLDTVRVYIEVEDAHKNRSTLNFDILPKPPERSDIKSPNYVRTMGFNQENDFAKNGFKMHIPANALYEDLDFEYKTSDTLNGALCPTHKVHNVFTPLQKKMKLDLQAEAPRGMENKLLVARHNGGTRFSGIGGTYNDGWVQAHTNKFGTYTVRVDSIAPKIVPLNTYPNKVFKTGETIRFKVSDGLSGVETINATMNGNWVLMEYDYKKGIAFHRWDERSGTPGKKLFKLTVMDERGNSKTYEVPLLFEE